MQEELSAVSFILRVVNAAVITTLVLWLFRFRREILARLDHIIENKRLSVALNLSVSSLRIDPKRFNPDKPELKRLVIFELARWWRERDRVGAYNAASAVLETSGWRQFVSPETMHNGRDALSRLMTNGDLETAKAFCEEIVDKL